ncbi:hypothetical protein TNCV_2458901 [Trichonephila clavipes]|nr:hypothetical protein TNCV_2458901 [Trichonephila clavipes]
MNGMLPFTKINGMIPFTKINGMLQFTKINGMLPFTKMNAAWPYYPSGRGHEFVFEEPQVQDLVSLKTSHLEGLVHVKSIMAEKSSRWRDGETPPFRLTSHMTRLLLHSSLPSGPKHTLRVHLPYGWQRWFLSLTVTVLQHLESVNFFLNQPVLVPWHTPRFLRKERFWHQTM